MARVIVEDKAQPQFPPLMYSKAIRQSILGHKIETLLAVVSIKCRWRNCKRI